MAHPHQVLVGPLCISVGHLEIQILVELRHNSGNILIVSYISQKLHELCRHMYALVMGDYSLDGYLERFILHF